MGTPFLGEVRIVAFTYPPKSWAFCNGQLLPINQNQALFSLLGTAYGGNGQTTFGLPDLRGRTPIHMGNNYTPGQAGGQPAHTLTQSEMPAHMHIPQATTTVGTTQIPGGNMLATVASRIYTDPANLTTLQPGSVSNTGGSQPHNNMQPYIVLNFCIALQGIFPSRN
ncbi:MAG TPA: tail fiber protein [Pyrinomonadaceae bacterium]